METNKETETSEEPPKRTVSRFKEILPQVTNQNPTVTVFFNCMS